MLLSNSVACEGYNSGSSSDDFPFDDDLLDYDDDEVFDLDDDGVLLDSDGDPIYY